MQWIVLCILIIAIVGERIHRNHVEKKLFQERVLAVMREIYFSESLTLDLSSFLGTAELAFGLCAGKLKPENYEYWDASLLSEMQTSYCYQPHYFAYLCALQCAYDLMPNDPDRIKIDRHCSRLQSLKLGL